MRHILSILMLWAAAHLTAQWTDPFDSILSEDWIGNRDHFIIHSAGKLQLNAKNAGSSSLWRFVAPGDTISWQFNVFLNFDPSSANKLEIYLLSDSASVDAKNALLLEIGENGLSDTWTIYYKEGAHKQMIASGSKGLLATGPLALKFHVISFLPNQWRIVLNDLLTDEYKWFGEFRFELPMLKDSLFFGLSCVYSETRKTAFSFDNISVGDDHTSPQIINHQLIDQHSLVFTFNETVDTSKSSGVNLFMHNLYGQPVLAEWSSPVQLKLVFDHEIVENYRDTLNYQKVKDVVGNSTESANYAFTIKNVQGPQYLDIIISEIMFDPTPARLLPETEYIEIFNRSDKQISLSACILYDESASTAFPDRTIGAHAYAILCNASDTAEFHTYGTVIPLSKLPTLNNEGDILGIRNKQGELLFETQYTSQDFDDPAKADGGYSLEWTSIHSLCDLGRGWKWSKHPLGGTPGFENSWIDTIHDLQAPVLQDIIPLSIWEIKLVFNKILHPLQIKAVSNFSLKPARGIATIDFTDKRNELILLLHQPLIQGEVYELIVQTVSDCQGNRSGFSTSKFALGVQPSPGDLVWSEVLFDAYSFHYDFVELYNRSHKYISLSQLEMTDGSDSTKAYPIDVDHVLAPGEYMAFTPDSKDLRTVYPHNSPKSIFENEILPLADEGASLVLKLNSGKELITIDSFSFSKSWHHPFIQDTEGKSLEKINMNWPSELKTSWQTAGHWVYYATPGLPNSQNFSLDSVRDVELYQLNSNRLSPNGDGFEDYIGLMFKLDQPAYQCNLDLFSLSGNRISPVYRDQISNGQLILWNGEDGTGYPLPAGNYVLSIQLVHPDGTKRFFKERVSLLR